jgi:hypothetical protein
VNTHKNTSKTRRKARTKRGVASNASSKEKRRPPLKRGQLKWQIARTISSLVVPRTAAASREKQDAAAFSAEDRDKSPGGS